MRSVPKLASLHLVGWDNNTKSVKRGTDTREVIRALKEAGDEAMPLREGAPGAGLQIALEGDGPLLVAELNSDV